MASHVPVLHWLVKHIATGGLLHSNNGTQLQTNKLHAFCAVQLCVFTNIRNTLMDTLAEETGERSVSFKCEATYRYIVPGVENS